LFPPENPTLSAGRANLQEQATTIAIEAAPFGVSYAEAGQLANLPCHAFNPV